MPQTLLLADDSVTIQRVIELTFADEDIKVVAVSDGDQAVAQLDAAPPDIVLADIGMPGKTGYEVAAYVKQSPRLQHIPVVLLTGAFEPVDQARASSVGCDGVLAKPFEPQLVITRVKELLTKGGRAAPPTVVAAAPAADPVAAAERPADIQKLDDYFDRLDAAFATLSPPAPPAQGSGPVSAPAGSDVDWFANEQLDAPPAADLPLSYGSPQAAFDRPAPAEPPTSVEAATPTPRYSAPVAIAPAPAPRTEPAPPARRPGAAESSPAEPVAFPPLAEAFAALLAAEQRSPAATSAPVWPVGSAPAITDDLVEQVVQRVLDRMSERVVRDTVAAIVSEVAERLVHDEIERIKSAIK